MTIEGSRFNEVDAAFAYDEGEGDLEVLRIGDRPTADISAAWGSLPRTCSSTANASGSSNGSMVPTSDIIDRPQEYRGFLGGSAVAGCRDWRLGWLLSCRDWRLIGGIPEEELLWESVC